MSSPAPIGHNNDVITGAAQTRLRTIIERVERLEEDKAAIMEDIKEVYAEAKGEGFDVKILRKIVTLRKKDKVKRQEEEAVMALYMEALGEQMPLPFSGGGVKQSPKVTMTVTAVLGEAADKALDDGDVMSAINLKQVSGYIEVAKRFIEDINRPFTVAEIRDRFKYTHDAAHNICSLLEQEGWITKADKNGLRRLIPQPAPA